VINEYESHSRCERDCERDCEECCEETVMETVNFVNDRKRVNAWAYLHSAVTCLLRVHERGMAG